LKVLKARKSDVRIVAVELRRSAVLSGCTPGPHHVPGAPTFFSAVLRWRPRRLAI
jgi:cysteine synthase